MEPTNQSPIEPTAEYKAAYVNNLLSLSDNHLEAWRRANLYDSVNQEEAEDKALAQYQLQACIQEQTRRKLANAELASASE